MSSLCPRHDRCYDPCIFRCMCEHATTWGTRKTPLSVISETLHASAITIRILVSFRNAVIYARRLKLLFYSILSLILLLLLCCCRNMNILKRKVECPTFCVPRLQHRHGTSGPYQQLQSMTHTTT